MALPQLPAPWGEPVRRHCYAPAAWGLVLLVAYLVLPLVFPGAGVETLVGRIFAIALILVLAWLATGLIEEP